MIHTMAFRNPAELNASDLSNFKLLVREGDEVEPALLDRLVPQARTLATVQTADTFIAVGGIKKPSERYRDRVFESAGVQGSVNYAWELGWVYVRKEFRGVGLAGGLVRGLVGGLDEEFAYATSSVENKSMHRLLQASGFDVSGEPYLSQRRQTELLLFLRPPAL